jgi:tRNA pseudouridine55 synthase
MKRLHQRAGTNRQDSEGILVVDKPSGMTSRAVVDLIARGLPGNKVGHSGTLDPLASGVLVICAGAATRLVEAIQGMHKSYKTVIRLGARSDTLDADGCIQDVENPPIPSTSQVECALESMSGSVLQKPPEFSALKVKGKRAYDLARAGHRVELAPRLVRIDLIAVLSYAWPFLALRVDCAGGTYIRSIARDVGEVLGCGGYLKTLVRTRVGPFTLEGAVTVEALSAVGAIFRHLRPAIEAVPDFPRVILNQSQVDAISCGRRLKSSDLASSVDLTGDVALVSEDGRLVALARSNPQEGWIQPCKVFLATGR